MIVVDLSLNYQKRNLKEKIYKLLLIISKSEIAKKGSWALLFKIGGMFSIYLFHFLLARRIGAEANGVFSTFFTTTDPAPITTFEQILTGRIVELLPI